MDENFYYSLDKLIEFGLGASIATQMISNMNQSIGSMTTPGAGNSLHPGENQFYFAVTEGTAKGPYSLSELARLINEGTIVKETYLWKPGMPKWDLAENMPEVLRLVAMKPPAIPSR